MAPHALLTRGAATALRALRDARVPIPGVDAIRETEPDPVRLPAPGPRDDIAQQRAVVFG